MLDALRLLICFLMIIAESFTVGQGSDFSASSAGFHDVRAEKLRNLFKLFHGDTVFSSKDRSLMDLLNYNNRFEHNLKKENEQVGNSVINKQFEKLPSLMKVIPDENVALNNNKPFSSSCRNVLSLRNEGSILFSFFGLVALDLEFNLTNEIIANDNITKAFIYVSSLAGSDPRNFRYTGSAFRYSVYHTSNHKNLEVDLERCLQRSLPSGVIPNIFDSEKVRSCLRHCLGAPIVSRDVTYANNRVMSQKTESLDVTRIWKKRPLSLSRDGDAKRKLVLIVSEHKHSGFSFVDVYEERCTESPPISLILMTDGPKCRSSHSTLGEAFYPFNAHPNKEENFDTVKEFMSLSSNRNLKRLSRKSRSLRSSVCQKHPMVVDFKDLGWSDWVIAPRSFQAYRCGGECPYPLGVTLNATNYALLLTMMNSFEQTNSPTPCCVPTNLIPLSVLYLDPSDNLVLHNYEDMIVESCGCR